MAVVHGMRTVRCLGLGSLWAVSVRFPAGAHAVQPLESSAQRLNAGKHASMNHHTQSQPLCDSGLPDQSINAAAVDAAYARGRVRVKPCENSLCSSRAHDRVL